jgi:hypothetical protein
LFCSASGLKVNLDKLTVHFSGLEEADLIPFKQLLPYKFTALDKGFKYLGYFLKVGRQKIEDWKWLITKVEKRISHWSFSWLSLGGRFTLCKAVLESQPVYWISLAAIPRSILHRLRKILFNFLWKGNIDASHLHLANWDSLARPKRFGGWGLLNIYNFSSALAATTLWRVLTTEGLWQKVLKEKYLCSTTIDTWLHSDTFTQPVASKMWKGLLKSIHLINNWLS